MAKNIEKWIVAQNRHHLSDKHVQMARELGLNPDKLGKIDNHKQEPWKAPLKDFIKKTYLKQFKKSEPENIRSLIQILQDEKRKEKEKKGKRESRKQNQINASTDDK